MATDTWKETEESPILELSSATGQGTYTRIFLAGKGRGLLLAKNNGFAPGLQITIHDQLFSFDRWRVGNYQGGYDRVECIFVSDQGRSSYSSSGMTGRPRKAGDEEWEASCAIRQMTVWEALVGDLINSTGGLEEEQVLIVPVPTLIQRVWSKGDAKVRPLPAKFADAISTFGAMLAIAGTKQGNFRCTDVRSEADGALLITTYTWEYDLSVHTFHTFAHTNGASS